MIASAAPANSINPRHTVQYPCTSDHCSSDHAVAPSVNTALIRLQVFASYSVCGVQERMSGACLTIPREPRWPGEGADARRAAQAVVEATAKPRNTADATLPANPPYPC